MAKAKPVIRWKVVAQEDDGVMHSYMIGIGSPLCCVYRIGDTTTAPIGGCLVFRTRDAGMAWGLPRKATVLRCECVERIKLPAFRSLHADRHDICQAWDGAKLNFAVAADWPCDTEAYRFVRPLEVVS